MTPQDNYFSTTAFWLFLLAAAGAIIWQVTRHTWHETGNRLDHDLPMLLNQDCEHHWVHYTNPNYQSCAECANNHRNNVYDQELANGTDLAAWAQEMDQ